MRDVALTCDPDEVSEYLLHASINKALELLTVVCAAKFALLIIESMWLAHVLFSRIDSLRYIGALSAELIDVQANFGR
jgi:hypothetical protein